MRIQNWRKHSFRTSWGIYLPRFYVGEPDIPSPKIDPWPNWHPKAFLTPEPPPTRNRIDRLADAEIAYQNWQIQKGREISQRGFGPQNASELQNLMAYQSDQGIQEIVNTSDHYMPEPFGSQDEFYSHGSSFEGIDYIEHTVGPQPEEMADMNNPEFIESAHDDGHMVHHTEPMEELEFMPEEQAQEPMPEPLEDPLHDPYDPMEPMEMDHLDLMNPMDMGGPFGP